MTNQEQIEIAKILLPLFAIIIAVISLVKTNRNTKRQIRVTKLEEMIESLRMFMANYDVLHIIYQRQHLFKNAPSNANKQQLEDLEHDFISAVKIFKETAKLEDIHEKTARLAMLANSYLPDKELKTKIISLVGLITNMINCTIYQNYESSRKIFTKYPSPLNLLQYIENVEAQILVEMNLGYKGIKFEKIKAYQTTFMKDLKI